MVARWRAYTPVNVPAMCWATTIGQEIVPIAFNIKGNALGPPVEMATTTKSTLTLEGDTLRATGATACGLEPEIFCRPQ